MAAIRASRAGRPVLILGTSLSALEVADAAAAQGLAVAGLIAWTSPPAPGEADQGELPVLSLDQAAALAASHLVVCGLDAPGREEAVERLGGLGFRFATVRHPSAYVAATAVLEEGCVVGAGACVSAYSRIARHAFLGPGALIGHHTTVGAHAVVGQGAMVAGSCRVGAGARLGPGARVIHRIHIGPQATVHPGAVVVTDVAAGSQVAGVPARPLV